MGGVGGVGGGLMSECVCSNTANMETQNMGEGDL